MRVASRRAFLGMSAISVGAAVFDPVRAIAACVTAPLPVFLPNMLTVDCASRRNFQLFRRSTTYMGLVGVVNMSFVRGKFGQYQAGNLFLFPWLKPAGLAQGSGKVWNSVMPTSATAVMAAAPIRSSLPPDEYFCNYILQAPPTSTFIGFTVDVPYSQLEEKLGLYSNIGKLADGKPVGIDWASSNLNHLWFGGNRQIPSTETCGGKAWRQLIANGLNLASAQVC